MRFSIEDLLGIQRESGRTEGNGIEETAHGSHQDNQGMINVAESAEHQENHISNDQRTEENDNLNQSSQEYAEGNLVIVESASDYEDMPLLSQQPLCVIPSQLIQDGGGRRNTQLLGVNQRNQAGDGGRAPNKRRSRAPARRGGKRRRMPIQITQSQTTNDEGSQEPEEPQPRAPTVKYFENFMVLDENTTTSKKFKSTQYRASYMLTNVEKLYPERELFSIFQRSLEVIMGEATLKNEEVDWISMSISTPGMDMPIFQNLHKLSDEAIATLVRKFESVDQSQRNKGKSPLVEEIISVVISIVSRNALKADKKQKIYAGSSRRRLQPNDVVNEFYRGVDPDSLIRIDNDDAYCLFCALNMVKAKAMLNRHRFHYYKRNKEQQDTDLQDVKDYLQLPEQQSYCITEYGDLLQDYLDEHFSDFGFKIFVFAEDDICEEMNLNSYFKPIWTSTVLSFKTPLSLFFTREGGRGHYDAIRNINLFHRCRKYCFVCTKPYNGDLSHNCEAKCRGCCSIIYDITPCAPEPNFEKHCENCNKEFKNFDCFERHVLNGACEKSKKCEKCGRLHYVGSEWPEHRCGFSFCRNCDTYHPFRRGCFIKKIVPDAEPLDYRIIIYDCETTQEQMMTNTKSKHFANFISATIICSRCIREDTWRNRLNEETDEICGICGSYRTISFSVHDYEQTEVDRKIITHNPMRRFMKWILSEFKSSDVENIIISHNGGRFDNVLLFYEIFQVHGIQPEIILQGNKFFEIAIKQEGIAPTYFRDSVNWMSLKLSQLPSAFGITGLQDKPFFPYLANKSDNLGRVMETLPPKEEYCYNSMLPKTKEAFDVWYAENCNQPFDLAESLASYCHNDVKILTYAVVELKKLFQETADVDILKCNTIAAACMRAFRMMLPNDEHLALVTEKGVGRDKLFKQSDIARKYLSWYGHLHNVTVQDCEHMDYERKIGNYRVDGFVTKEQRPEPENEKDLVLEVHGCFYHACEHCHPDDQEPLLGNRTAGKIRERNRQREEELQRLGEEQNFELQIKWECEIKAELEVNAEMKKYFDNCLTAGAIRLRDSLSGGRTEVFKMFDQADDEYEIKYLDVQSLYPFQLYSKKFSISHPKCKIFNRVVEWSRLSDLEEYEERTNDVYLNGLIKCLIVPPRNLRFPAIQAKFDDSNLLFPLCRSCSNERRSDGVYMDNSFCCPHHDWRDRSWITTITRPELELALSKRYVVKKIFRSYYFEQWDSQLFRSYVKKFLKIKIQSSGWPDVCTHPRFPDELPDVLDPTLTNEDVEIINKLREERAAYVRETSIEVDVDIEPEKVKKNAGLRYIAKLSLNNLWGRFALRNRLPQSKVVTDPGVFLEYLENKKIEINSFVHLNDESLLLTFTTKEEYMEENRCSNLPISIFTTAYARVHLYKIIEKLKNANATILYVDTDSVIYKYKKSEGMPLEVGQTLGTLTDEYPRHRILEFVASGCKSYALKLLNNETGEIQFVMKCKGLTLDHDACSQLPYERFKSNVLNYYKAKNYEKIIFEFNKIRNNKEGEVFTLETSKIWSPLITKGNVYKDGTILPFGYSDFNDEDWKLSYYNYARDLPYHLFELHPVEKLISDSEYDELMGNPGDPFASESESETIIYDEEEDEGDDEEMEYEAEEWGFEEEEEEEEENE